MDMFIDRAIFEDFFEAIINWSIYNIKLPVWLVGKIMGKTLIKSILIYWIESVQYKF